MEVRVSTKGFPRQTARGEEQKLAKIKEEIEEAQNDPSAERSRPARLPRREDLPRREVTTYSFLSHMLSETNLLPAGVPDVASFANILPTIAMGFKGNPDKQQRKGVISSLQKMMAGLMSSTSSVKEEE